LRDFQARRESRFLDFSGLRLFPSPTRGNFFVFQGDSFRAVVAEKLGAVSNSEGSIQGLVYGDRTGGQGGPPTGACNLQSTVLKAHRVVSVHGGFELQREDQVQISAGAAHKRTATRRSRHLKASLELANVVFAQKTIGCLQSADFAQPQLLRQTPLPGAEVA